MSYRYIPPTVDINVDVSTSHVSFRVDGGVVRVDVAVQDSHGGSWPFTATLPELRAAAKITAAESTGLVTLLKKLVGIALTSQNFVEVP